MQTWILLVIASLVLAGCGNSADIGKTAVARVVQLTEVKAQTAQSLFTFPAKVAPKSTVDLAFRVGGRLQTMALPEGQYVKKGTLLAKLDPEPFKRAVSIAEVRLKQAKLELNRVEAIATKGIGSAKSVDNALVAFELAKLAVDNSKSNLKYSELRAPYHALVAKRLIENEGFVKKGRAIARLQDFSRVHFEFEVSERLVSYYSHDQVAEASVYIDGAIDQKFKIKYVEHSTEPNPVTQTYQVVYAMDSPKGLHITPGGRATVSLKGNSKGAFSMVGVPVNAVVAGTDNKLYVWLFNEENKTVSKQEVVVGPMAHGWIAVLSGLTSSQRVVAAGASQMQDGMLVRPYVMQ